MFDVFWCKLRIRLYFSDDILSGSSRNASIKKTLFAISKYFSISCWLFSSSRIYYKHRREIASNVWCYSICISKKVELKCLLLPGMQLKYGRVQISEGLVLLNDSLCRKQERFLRSSEKAFHWFSLMFWKSKNSCLIKNAIHDRSHLLMEAAFFCVHFRSPKGQNLAICRPLFLGR